VSPSAADLPRRRPDTKLASFLDRALLIGAAALLAVGATFVLLYAAHGERARWTEHSRRAARMARQTLVLAVNRETGVRGYLLTRDSLLLAPDLGARGPLAAKLDSLTALTADNPVQQERVRAARAALAAWERDFATPALAAAAAGAPPATEAVHAGKTRFDVVRVHLGAFLDDEDALYVERAARDRWVLRAALVAVLVELVVLLAALAALRQRAVGQARGLAAQQYQLEEQAVELEQQTEESVELARNLETANAALRESEERTRLTVEGVRDYAIVRLDAAGTVLSWNAGAAQVLGWEADEIVGRPRTTFSPPDDVEAGRPQRALEAAARDGRCEEEGWLLRKDGARFWASVLVSPLRDASGRLLGYVQVTRDLTERRQAELALREQYELLRTVLAASGDLVFAKDLDGRYLVANEAVARVHGRAAAEIVGRSDAELFGPERAAEMRATDARTLASGATLRVEETAVVGGERRTFRSTRSVLRDAAGRPAGVVGVSMDVTDAQRAAEALRQANRELAATTYSIAHDLRSPLRALDGFSRILEIDHAGQLDAEGIALLRRIRSNSQRMGELIDGILGLARLGQGDLQVRRVELSALAQGVLDELRRAHPDRRVEARVEPGLAAAGDPRLLALVVQNLLENAWKFTRDRDPARIEFGQEAHGGEAAYFVRDNGAGFDPAYAGQLFGAFQRLHRASEFEGHGIGLASVKRVVERHGGRVWADGAEGRGATFYFTLGAVRPAAARGRAAGAAGGPQESA
jgi:PAS domain S-box-containing protein